MVKTNWRIGGKMTELKTNHGKPIKLCARTKSKMPFADIVRTRKFKKKLFITLGLLWPTAHFLVFVLYINADTILMSFQRFNVFKGEYMYAGIDNYKKLFQALNGYPSKTLLKSVVNSFLFLPWNVLVLLPLSLVAAYILYKKIIGHRIFRIIFFLPSVISIVVLTMMFKFSFDSSIGIVNPLLSFLGWGDLIPKGGWFGNAASAFPMVLFYCLWVGIGYNVVLATGAMVRIPSDVIESAKLDGIGFFREFRSITIPMVSPTINTLIVTGSAAVFTLFLQPQLLTAGGPDNSTFTIAYVINELVRGPSADLNYAATIGVFFTLIGVPFILGLKALVGKILPDVEY
jgi:ABC-type sugar transport system permease subunit